MYKYTHVYTIYNQTTRQIKKKSMFPSNGIKKNQQQKKTTDFPQSSQPRPRVSGHCPTSWALNGVNSRLLSLQVPEKWPKQ